MKNYLLVAVTLIAFLSPDDKKNLVGLHNEERWRWSQSHPDSKIGPLEEHKLLTLAAQKHAEWMNTVDKLDHIGLNNSQPWDRLKKVYTIVGENIAEGQSTPEEVMQDWINSYGHHKNIVMTRFRYMGVGIKGKYWCVMFSD